jgi:transposase
VQLAQQAKDILGQSDLVMITERVDDVALLIGQMVQMGLPEVWDRHIPRHGPPRGLRWGGTAVLGLASIGTEGDHRQVSVATSLQGRPHTLSPLTAQALEPLDVRDARLSPRLQHLRPPASWHRRERDLHERRMAIDALSQDVLRWDATTGSGEHEGTEEGLLQCGQSQEEPARPQSQVRRGALAPGGLPLATAVLAGERAEAGFYLPSRERLWTSWQTPGRVFVGDGTMSAWATRASLARPPDVDWSPLPLPGAPAAAMDAWRTAGVRPGERGA